MPVVETPTLRQDERGKDLLFCVTSELASFTKSELAS